MSDVYKTYGTIITDMTTVAGNVVTREWDITCNPDWVTRYGSDPAAWPAAILGAFQTPMAGRLPGIFSPETITFIP